MENKVKYGLRNAHYALLSEGTEGEITYATPKPLPGAVSIKFSPEEESVEFWADDMLYYDEKANGGYKGDLELSLIPETFATEVLGVVTDTQGLLVENADAVPKKIALLFEFSGDAKKTRYVFYNVSVGRPNLDGKTSTKNKEPQTETLSFTASAHPKLRDIKAACKEGTPKYDTWFNAVTVPIKQA